MGSRKYAGWAACGLAVVVLAAAWPVQAAPCSRFEDRGLAPGMTSKQVWNLMGGKGQQTEIAVAGFGRRSVAQYVLNGATIKIEYDGLISRRNEPRITRIETRRLERDIAYNEVLQSLVDRVGRPPIGGMPDAEGGPARWVDEACQVEVATSRHVPDWWEPGQGPTIHVEVRALSPATADLLARADQRPEAQTATPGNAPTSSPDPQTVDAQVATPVANDTRVADAGNAGTKATDNSDTPVAAGSDTARPKTQTTDAKSRDEVEPPVADADRPEPLPLRAAATSAANADGAEVRAPVVLYNPPPRYPAAARMLNLGGQVILEVLVNEQGSVDDVIVSSSEANKILRNTAKRAVRRWRYEPATKDGVPVSMWTTVTIGFDRPKP